jgi:hypothetical protein
MGDAKANDAKPDQRNVEEPDNADDDAYVVSVLEAWRKRPFLVGGAKERVNGAKETAERLKGLGFRAYLDGDDALLIADMTGMGRDLSRFLSPADIADAFSTLVAGLTEDPQLLEPFQPTPQRRGIKELATLAGAAVREERNEPDRGNENGRRGF